MAVAPQYVIIELDNFIWIIFSAFKLYFKIHYIIPAREMENGR